MRGEKQEGRPNGRPGRLGSGGRIRTCDLRVMSPTSYRTAPPRDETGLSDCIPGPRHCKVAGQGRRTRASVKGTRHLPIHCREAMIRDQAQASARWAATAAAFACALGALLLVLLPATAIATPRRPGPRGRCRPRRRRRAPQVARLDRASQIAIEKYNVARSELDGLNVRLIETRRDLSRAQLQLDVARAVLGERMADIYKSGGVERARRGDRRPGLHRDRHADRLLPADQPGRRRQRRRHRDAHRERGHAGRSGRERPRRGAHSRDGPAREARRRRGPAGGAAGAARRPRHPRQGSSSSARPASTPPRRSASPTPPASTSTASTAAPPRSRSSRRP